ncbi:MAG TPA: hypothetical protein VFZ65_09905 [Planctomycetota bacterium]|nr:hypothetical protein [Planctomycetota bacterium]
MNPIHRVLLLPIALGVPGLLSAQTPPAGPSAVPTENMIPWPAGLGSGVLRKVVGLFWDSVDHPSAIAVRGTATARAIDPAITSYIEPFSGEMVIDCVKLPHAGLLGPPSDGLLMSVLGGAELRFGYVDGNGIPQFLPLSFPEWLRASAMAVLADGTGIDIAARSMTGNQLLRLRYDYQQRAFAQLAPLTLTETIRDLCVIDFDGDGLGDVAVLTDSHVRIYDVNGGVAFSMQLAHAGGAIEPVPEPGQRGALALLQRNAANDGWQLLHITRFEIQPPVDILIDGASFTLGGLVSGDLDDDGDYDLAIQNGDTKVLLVRNHVDPTVVPAAPHFDSTDTRVLIAGNQIGVQTSACMVDSDFDGAADLIAAVQANNGQGYLVVRTALRSLFEIDAEYYPDIFTDSFHELVNGEKTMRLNLCNLGGLSSDYTQVEVTYYTASEQAVTEGGYASEVTATTQQIEPGAQDMTIETPMAAANIDNPQLLFVKVQFSNPNIIKAKPTFLAGATIDDDLVWGQTLDISSAYLSAHRLPDTTEMQVKRELQDPNNPNNQGRQQIGLIGAQKSLPYF